MLKTKQNADILNNRIIESFQGWLNATCAINENVKEAQAFMLNLWAERSGKTPAELTQEERSSILQEPRYREVLELVQATPGYAGAFVKFRFLHRATIQQLASLLERIKKNGQFLGELSMPVTEFPNHTKIHGVGPLEALNDEFDKIETDRSARWIITDLPGDLRRSVKALDKEQINKLLNAAVLIDKIDAKSPARPGQLSHKARLLKGTRAYSAQDPLFFVSSVEQYVESLSNEQTKDIVDAVEELEPEAGLIYADDTYVVVSVRTERAQKGLCAKARWCLNTGSFNSKQYGGGAVQINTFNFGVPMTDPMHLVGTTISYEGKVTYSNNMNNTNVKASGSIEEHFAKLGYPQSLIAALTRAFPVESLIKKVVTDLGLDNKKPITVLHDIIKKSYKVDGPQDPQAIKIMLNILEERLVPEISQDDIVELYLKSGILSVFSAQVFLALTKGVSVETREKVIKKAKGVFDEIKQIASKGTFSSPQLTAAINAEPEIMQILGEEVGEISEAVFAAEPIIKEPTPITKPATPRPGPIPTTRPAVIPEPSAEAEEVIERLMQELNKRGISLKEFLK